MIHPKLKNTMSQITGLPEKNGDLGVELEIEGDNLPREVSGWTVKQELSLRGKEGRVVTENEDLPDTPKEYVTRTPCTFSNLEKKLETVHGLLTKQHVAVRLTQRASTHIHLNMGTETFQTFLAFLLVFTAIEPVLLRLCGPLRNGNLFCMPSYETGELGKMINKLGTYALSMGKWPTRGKYAALNTDTIGSFGSVEIRCFPNTIDPQLVLKWARWLLNIRDMARQSDETFTVLLDRMYGNPRAMLSGIFGYEDLITASSPQHPVDLTMFGIEQAYELWREMQYLLDWREPEKTSLKKKPLKFNGIYDDYGNSIDGPSAAQMAPWNIEPQTAADPTFFDELGED